MRRYWYFLTTLGGKWPAGIDVNSFLCDIIPNYHLGRQSIILITGTQRIDNVG